MTNKILEWLILGIEEDVSYRFPGKYKDFTDWYFVKPRKSQKFSGVRRRIPREQIERERERFNSYGKLHKFAKTKKDKQILHNTINEHYEQLTNFYNYLSNEVLSSLDIWLSEKESASIDRKRNLIEYPMKMDELLKTYLCSIECRGLNHYDRGSKEAVKFIEKNFEAIKSQALRFKKRSDYYSKKLK